MSIEDEFPDTYKPVQPEPYVPQEEDPLTPKFKPTEKSSKRSGRAIYLDQINPLDRCDYLIKNANDMIKIWTMKRDELIAIKSRL